METISPSTENEIATTRSLEEALRNGKLVYQPKTMQDWLDALPVFFSRYNSDPQFKREVDERIDRNHGR